MRKILTDAQLVARKMQTSLFDESIFESTEAILADYKIASDWTRNAVKICISRINYDDEYFKQETIKLTELVGGWQKANGTTYTIGKEQAKKMVSDYLCVETIPGVEAVAVTYFDGTVIYNEEKREIICRLNPALKRFYINLKKRFSVLQLGEYLSLPTAFDKDLYEWIIGHQGEKDFSFSITVEKFCKHFNCLSYIGTNRSKLIEKIEKAKKKIEMLTMLRFNIAPEFVTKKGKKTLSKINFKVKTGVYYKLAQEEKAKREDAEARLQQAQETSALLQEAASLREQRTMMDQMIGVIESDMFKDNAVAAIERKMEEENKKSKKRIYATIDDIPDDKWNEMIREALGDLYFPPDDEEENFVIEDDITEEEIEEARRLDEQRRMEAMREEEGYYADGEISKFFEDE